MVTISNAMNALYTKIRDLNGNEHVRGNASTTGNIETVTPQHPVMMTVMIGTLQDNTRQAIKRWFCEMNIELDFSNCDSFELLDIYDSVLNELRNRLGRGVIFRANNGKIYPKTCPKCGCKLVVTHNQLNLTQVEIDAIRNSTALGEYPAQRWRNFIEQSVKDGKIMLPPNYCGFVGIYIDEPGDWYAVSCDCHIGEWKHNYDEAVESWWQRKILKLESKND